MNKITNIFYGQIIPEAATGHIKCFFKYNMPFNTNIEGRLIKVKGIEQLFIPTLMIKNRGEFDKLLVEYVNKAMEFYEDDELDEKAIMTLLWSNATSEDFQNPITFLKKRIAFLDDQSLIAAISNIKPIESEILKCSIVVDIVRNKIVNETPYKIKIVLKSHDNEEYELPAVYVGLFENRAYVYAIQNDNDFKVTNGFQKKIKRLLYGIDKGLDVLNETREKYDFGNLKDVTSSFVLTANILMGILNRMGMEEIIVPSILMTRWNAKEMAIDFRQKILGMDEEETEAFRTEHEGIQSNLTEKLTRTFLRLCHHHSGIEVTSYPMEVDSSLHLNIRDASECNNSILAETYDLFKGRQR